MIGKRYKKKREVTEHERLCEHTDVPHYSSGLCKKCYLRRYYLLNKSKKKERKQLLQKKKDANSESQQTKCPLPAEGKELHAKHVKSIPFGLEKINSDDVDIDIEHNEQRIFDIC